VTTVIPSLQFPPWELANLAARYGVEEKYLEAVVEDAAQYYRTGRLAEEWNRSTDTLNKIAKPAQMLLALLADEVNRDRLLANLFGIKDGYATNDIFAIGQEFEQGLRFLETIRLAAPKAHLKRPRKRPTTKADLAAALRFLKRHFFDMNMDAFTNTWEETTEGLRPRSYAAKLIFEIMSLIDPNRPELAKELRDLMRKVIENEGGLRSGRREGRLKYPPKGIYNATFGKAYKPSTRLLP
jgi:hypothetical protein